VQVYPDRLSRRNVDGRAAAGPPSLTQLQFLVERGLRAQLRTGNLLTGQVFVALDFFPKAPPVKFDPTRTPVELPTVSSGLDELQSQVQEVIAKVNKVPFEQIGSDLHTTLASLDRTLSGAEQLIRTLNNDVSPEITAAVKDARKTLTSAERTLNTADKTLSSADRTLASDAPLQQDLRQMLQELSRTAASVRVLTDYLERHPESLLRGKPDDKK
jgi:paraquat-inducible protein B